MEKGKIKLDSILLIGIFLLFNVVLTFWSSYYNFLGKYLYYITIPFIVFAILVKKYNPFKNRLFLNYLLFLFFAIFTSVVFFGRTDNLHRLFIVCCFQIPLMLGIDCYCTDEEKLKKIMKAYVFASVIMSIMVLLAGSYGKSSLRFGWSVTGNQPNTPALNLGLAISITFYNFWVKKEKKSLNLFLTILFLFVIFLTGSRKMMLYAVLTFVLILLFSTKNVMKTLRNIFLIFIFLLVSYISLNRIPILYNTIGYRLFYINSDSSAGERDELRKGAIEHFRQSPIIGNGLDTYKDNNSYGLYAHDNYAELLSGVGIIGLIIYYLYKFKYTWVLFYNRSNGYNLLFSVVMISLFAVERYSVNYLQWAIFSAYAMSYSQYRLFMKKKRVLE